MLVGGITWFSSGEDDDFGWTAYTPLTDVPRRYTDYLPSDRFDQMSVIALTGFCLLVLAALVEAIAVRRFGTGIVTVAVPFVAAALIWCALPRGHWNFHLKPVAALLVILVAMATREVWERRFAPTVAPA